jgi:Glycine/D-amino acid oxidases (deaminating)
MVLRKQLALARSFGVECEEIGAAEAGALFPPLRTDDLAGAIWIPGDGKANPADLRCRSPRGRATAACGSSKAPRPPE